MTGSTTTDPCTAEAVPGNETFPVPALSLNYVFCNFRNTAFVTLSIKSSTQAYGGRAGAGSWSACSSFSSTLPRRLAGCCSDSCKIVVFLFTLADTRRDILKRKITQHQYTCKLVTYSKLFHCWWGHYAQKEPIQIINFSKCPMIHVKWMPIGMIWINNMHQQH